MQATRGGCSCPLLSLPSSRLRVKGQAKVDAAIVAKQTGHRQWSVEVNVRPGSKKPDMKQADACLLGRCPFLDWPCFWIHTFL